MSLCQNCGTVKAELTINLKWLGWNINLCHSCSSIYCKTQLELLDQALERSGLDLTPCHLCAHIIVAIPDGLPYCESCSKKLGE